MTAHRALLVDYSANGSEEAFRELVTCYLSLVYGTAMRLVEGNTQLAEEVTQTVFTDLARLAGTLSGEVMLGGWLHRRACHVAATVMRSERRRQYRQRLAAEMNALQDRPDPSWNQIAPVLDEAINQLSVADRTAIMLRFFEDRDLRSIGEALGSNEEAARKRVARALDKLRSLLGRRGVTASTAALGAMLSTQVLTAVPVGLAASTSSAALASAMSTSGITLALLKLMAATKLKIAFGTIIVAGIGTAIVMEHQAQARLRAENEALQIQLAERRPRAILQSNRPAISRETAQDELNRLREAINSLHPQTIQTAKLRTENRALRNATDEPEDPAEAEFKQETEQRNNQLKTWGLDFHIYASQHKDQLPETWEQVVSVSQMGANLKDPEELAAFMNQLTNSFEIVYRGKTDGIPNPGETILFREKQARRSPKGEWVKVYGFADGSTQIHTESEDHFEAWEQQHLAEAQNNPPQ